MDWQPVTAAVTKAEAKIGFTQWCQRNSVLNLFMDNIRIDVYKSDRDVVLNRYSVSRRLLKDNYPHLLEEI